MSSKVTIALLGVALMVLFSCSSSRRGASGESGADQPSAFTYETLGAKISLSAGNMNLNATLRMKKDSFLFISVQPFAGIEVARIFVSDKDVTLIDRMNKNHTIALNGLAFTIIADTMTGIRRSMAVTVRLPKS